MDEASARFHEHEGTDEDGMVIALTETVVWVVALDDLLVKSDPGYGSRKAQEPNAAVLLGLHLVRNLGVHQVAVVHETVAGTRYPRRYPRSYRSVTWRQTSELPQPDRGYERPHLELAYDEHLAGRQVWPTIDAAQLFLREALV